MGTCIPTKLSVKRLENPQKQQECQKVSQKQLDIFIKLELEQPIFFFNNFTDQFIRIQNPKEFKAQYKKLRQLCAKYRILSTTYLQHKQDEYLLFNPNIIIEDIFDSQDSGLSIQTKKEDDGFVIENIQLTLKHQAIYCKFFVNEPCIIISKPSEAKNKLQLGNLNLYQIEENTIQNEYLPFGYLGNYIGEFVVEDTKFKRNLIQLRTDIQEGLFLLSYESLKEHMKRRLLKSYHLWILMAIQGQNKSLIACSIFVNYLKKQSKKIEEELHRISKGGVLYFTQDRIRCLDVINELSDNEIQYIMSDQIVQDIISISLSNARILMLCLEQKFSIKLKQKIKQIGYIDSHYFTSSAFHKYYNIIEEYQQKIEPLLSDIELEFQWLVKHDEPSSYEFFLPSVFYNQEKQKFHIPSLFILQEWSTFLYQSNVQTSIGIQTCKLLMQIQNPENIIEDVSFQLIQFQLLDVLFKGYQMESQKDCQRFYELAIKLCRQCFGDYRNRGSILFPIEAFCWHRLSVIASYNGDSLSVIQHFFSQFQNLNLPCNNIQSHNYKSKELSQILHASIKGFMLYEWLFKRFNELYAENIETSDPQFMYQPGQIIMWGFNQNYQLGQENQIKYDIPISLKSDIMFTKIKCGYKHTLAICNSGRVYCWGNNEDGKCGQPSSIKYIKSPTLLESSKDCVVIECGHDHSTYLDKQGLVYSWGCGEGGLLGNGKFESTHTPQLVQLKGKCQQLKCGGLHNAAIVDGKLFVWGRGDGGQLGLPLELGFEISTPTQVQLNDQVIQVACGDAHTIILNGQKQVYGWGYNEQGQLGQSLEIKSQLNPILLIENVDQIYAGSLQSYFIKEDRLYGCGCNDDGQLGIQGNDIGIHLIFNYKVENLAIGQDHTLCISQNKVFGWGLNKFGELLKSTITTPQEIFPFKVQSLDCGAYHSGVVIFGTEKYSAYKCFYDYSIKYDFK